MSSKEAKNKYPKTSENLIGTRELIVVKSDKDNIQLKQLLLDDAQDYFALVNSDRSHLSQHGDLTANKYPDVESVENSIFHPKNPNKYRFGIWDEGVMVGSNNLTPKDGNRAELGSWIGKLYTGKNYAHRARLLLIDFAFNKLELEEVFCEIVIGNIPSKKSVEKTGFKLTGEKNGKWIYTLSNPFK